ncbi:FAD dependent oxidoreductase [Cordyceps fumosorosea ARSEF 2679]|uniref:FAD dependent oxidoreductase n=1 Tax=Cordyceps fumosorosea (strain ARSEF 2679) TaxID=1081104 RepID=A0A168DFB1_CORFA|nr:FAD dependent oxidoreductase [Cordyceps fumosorosea ARSEF 2679]OAA72541.1 FAD dependent oxidoreductase [Cordyceps fumosorosea ARSEF 2679]
MDGKRNIVIIGGGIIGNTTAYFLTRHPKFNPALHSITILEAGSAIATGASGKAGGLLALWAYPSCLVPLSYKLHAELAAEHNGPERWGYRKVQCGSIAASVSESRIAELQTTTRAAGAGATTEEDGKAWEKLPKQDIAAQELLEGGAPLPDELDWVDRDVVLDWSEMSRGGAADTAQVHPYQFTLGMAELAAAAGVTTRNKMQVTAIKTAADGKVSGVEYKDRATGTTATLDDITDLIVAAGPWTGRLLPRSKVEGLRAHSVVYEADLSAFAVFSDVALPRSFVPAHRQKRTHKGRVDPEIYARPFKEAYACGEPDTLIPLPEVVDEVRHDDALCDDLAAYVATFSRVLAAAPIKARQACYLPRHMRFGQESGPLIGATTVPGLYVASGHTCWGIQNAPATGKLMAEIVLDGKASSADIDNLDPRKFKV